MIANENELPSLLEDFPIAVVMSRLTSGFSIIGLLPAVWYICSGFLIMLVFKIVTNN